MTYLEKLKDPRWQKKRLEILQRDEWICQCCFDTESTLNVHHRIYSKNKEPWDYDNKYLLTLCEECHAEEKNQRKEEEQLLLHVLREKFLTAEINSLAIGFHNMELVHLPGVQASAIEYMLEDRNLLKELIKKYFIKLQHGRQQTMV